MFKYIKKKEKEYLLFFGFFLSLTGLYLFLIGFHSMDLAWNFIRVEYQINDIFNSSIRLYDTTTSYQNYYMGTLYLDGVRKIFSGFFIGIIGALLFGQGYAMKR